MSWMKLIGLVVAAAVAVVVALAIWGRASWDRRTGDLVARLEAGRTAPQLGRFDRGELAGLPAPVARYLEAVLPDGVPIVAAARLTQTGTINLSEDGEDWRDFTATQRVVTRRPGFVWDARLPILPGIAIHVHDAYVAGEGLLRPAIGGLITLTEQRGGGDIADGELTRFFAETPWYPTALLPSQGVRWEAIDERSARATLSDGAIVLTLTFAFGDDGLIASIRAESRGRTVGGRIVATPWEGRFSDYRREAGLLVPMRGEVAWLLPEGRRPYWRGEITAIKYEPGG